MARGRFARGFGRCAGDVPDSLPRNWKPPKVGSGFEAPKSEQNLGRRSTARAPGWRGRLHGCAHRERVAPRLPRCEGHREAPPNSSRARPIAGASVTLSRQSLGRAHVPSASEADRFWGGSRWQEIHECRATEWPNYQTPRQARGHAPKPLRGTVSPRGGRTQGCWYRRRSPATPLVGEGTELIPVGLGSLCLKPLSTKAGPSQLEGLSRLRSLRQRQPQPLFD